MINVFTRDFCPNCDDVKSKLKELNIAFVELDVDNFKNKAKLVVRGLKELPVLSHDNKYEEFSDIDSAVKFANNFLGFPEVKLND